MADELRNKGHASAQEEKQLRKVIRDAPMLIFQAAASGDCLGVNRQWEQQTGLTEAGSLGNGWLAHIDEADARQMLEAVHEKAKAGEDSLECMVGILRADGVTRRQPVYIQIDRDSQGALRSFTGYMHTGENPRTRDLHALIGSLEDIIFEIDYHKIFCNVWTRDDSQLFLPREQFLNRTVEEVFGEHATPFVEAIDEVIRTGKPQELIYQGLYQFSHLWFRAKIRPVSSEALEGDPSMVVVIQEYTETRAYWEALEKATRELEQGKRLLDISEQLSLSSGWELDTATGQVTMTDQAYHIYGLPVGTSVTVDAFRSFYAPRDWEYLMEKLDAALSTQENIDLELHITARSGQKKWVRLIAVPIVNAHEVTGIVGALMDVSHKKAIEQELIEAKTLAETAAREKTDFLSVMSHEIRTPLNNIIGLANLLKLEHLPGNAEYIDNLIFSSNHLLQLIGDILSLHKIEEGKFDAHLQKTNLAELVDNIIKQFLPFANEKNIRLEHIGDAAIPSTVMANRTFLAQVLNNLISNAIKFTEKGTVTIRLSAIDRSGQSVQVRFSVSDTGIGIPHAKQEVVFEQFRQLRSGAASKYPSTGLGLTITRKLIESRGSRIYLISEPGRGSEFYFDLWFPLPDDNSEAGTTDTSPASVEAYRGKLGDLRLLLVEDNPVNIAITKKQLGYLGVKADCAVTGAEALAMLEANSYHALLLDLYIPEPDGYQVAAIVRDRYPSIRTIVFTADSLTEDEPRISALGITEILKKPFLPDELLSILLRVSGRGRTPD